MHTQPQVETGRLEEEEGGTDAEHPNTHGYPSLVPADWLSHLTFHIKQPALTTFFTWHATSRLLWSCYTCSAWKPFSPFPTCNSLFVKMYLKGPFHLEGELVSHQMEGASRGPVLGHRLYSGTEIKTWWRCFHFNELVYTSHDFTFIMVLLAITSTFENNCWSGASIPALLLLCFCPRTSSMTCLSSIRIKNLLYSVFTSFPRNYFGSFRTSLIENDGSPLKLVLIGTCNWEFLRLSLVLGSKFSNKIINNHSTCFSYQMLGSK